LVKGLIEEARRAGCRLAAACSELGISLRTYQRWQLEEGMADRRKNAKRPAPANRLSAEEREQVLAVINSAEFASMPPSQIVPTLIDRNVYLASESSFYRIMREAAQQRHRGRARKPKARPISSHRATAPKQLWSWDITWLPTRVKGKYLYWYMVMDVYSRKIVGHEVYEVEAAALGARLMRRASLSEGLAGRELVLHSDNGSAMKGATMLATLERLGIMPSFSRPRVSNDNPYAESLFKTCKYRPEYPDRPFLDLEDARAWTNGFVKWYNNVHKHSALKYVTPAQRHDGEDVEVLRKRERAYAAAKARRPERWSGSTRNWEAAKEVWLNPERSCIENLRHAA